MVDEPIEPDVILEPEVDTGMTIPPEDEPGEDEPGDRMDSEP